MAVDRPLRPRGESKCARSGAPTGRFNTAVEADEDRIFAHFHNPRLERTHLHPFLAFGVAAAPRSRRSPPMSRSSRSPVLYAVPAPANRQTDRQTELMTQENSPLRPLSSSASGSADVGRPPGALRHVTRPLRKNTRTRSVPSGADSAIYSFPHVALKVEFSY